jgi:hypothetical protein
MDGLTPEGAPDDMCRVLRLRDVCRLPAIQPFSNPTIQQSNHSAIHPQSARLRAHHHPDI